MPRAARQLGDGCCYHILNRGNARQRVFHDDADLQSFIDLLAEARERFPAKIFAYCLMPNHFHLLVQGTGSEGACPDGVGRNDDSASQTPRGAGTIGSSSMEPVPGSSGPTGTLSKFMQWVTTTHVRRYHRRYNTSGHVWQGRFKSFLVQEDGHLLTVARYVEGNPSRAGLVTRALEWPWSSFGENAGLAEHTLTTAMPIPFPGDWAAFVDEPLTGKEQNRMSRSLHRQSPFGTDIWLHGQGLAP